MHKRPAFTLVEVLISITLLGIILPALYSSVDLLHDSNTHLFEYMQKSRNEVQISQTLFLDIASSDGNITHSNGEFDHICMEHTQNSLYGLSLAKVCWIVLKKEHALLRIEGGVFHLPLKEDERVEVDLVMKNLSLFDVYRQKDKVVVLLKQNKQEPVAFMVQGITQPQVKQKKNPNKVKKRSQQNVSGKRPS
jgi:prepilin-type N-terminal cleavage/methylation domain-containing protein